MCISVYGDEDLGDKVRHFFAQCHDPRYQDGRSKTTSALVPATICPGSIRATCASTVNTAMTVTTVMVHTSAVTTLLPLASM
jgi:hypothetical protein